MRPVVGPGAALHADAIGTLAAWTPPSPAQAALRDRYLAHLRSRPDGLARSCHPAHLTASALVISEDGRHVLLTLHAKAGRWFQFGGHLESGDHSLAGASAREAREESGLPGLLVGPQPVQLSAHEVVFCHPAGPVDHLDVRYAARTAYTPPVVGPESLDVRWWPVSGLPEPDPDLRELVEWGVRATTGRGTRA